LTALICSPRESFIQFLLNILPYFLLTRKYEFTEHIKLFSSNKPDANEFQERRSNVFRAFQALFIKKNRVLALITVLLLK